MTGKFIFALLTLGVTLVSAAPNGIQNEYYYITNLGGGVLTAYPQVPPTQPGHTYAFPGRVFVEETRNMPQQRWLIETSDNVIAHFRSEANGGNELEWWMPHPENVPSYNSWRLIEDVSMPGTYYIQNTHTNYCINHDGLDKKILHAICSSTGTESKWTFELANGD